MSKRNVKIVFIILGLFLIWRACFRQGDHWSEVGERGLIVRLDSRMPSDELTSLLLDLGLDQLNIDSLFAHEHLGIYADQGWSLERKSDYLIELRLPMDHSSSGWVPKGLLADFGTQGGIDDPGRGLSYGKNNWLDQAPVATMEDGARIFRLTNIPSATSVYIAGSFNEWSTMSHPMTTQDGKEWELKLHLAPGRHVYKFLVDEFKWMADPLNPQVEMDTYGGEQSVLFVENHTFQLKGYHQAQEVRVTGSFNNWNERELLMLRTQDGWELPMFLGEGTHAYKFIVDGQWMLDPDNSVIRDDGSGNQNSFVSIGDTIYFQLSGFTQAKDVYVAGEFNVWNFSELRMQQTQEGWVLPYVLPPGNYEYKFKVDETYLPDPVNPLSKGQGDFMNSIIVVKPNVELVLKGYPDASSVAVSGDFNAWDNQGFTMKKRQGDWIIQLYLAPGKMRYKFIVDGQWILDPDNPFYEENEYGTGNSVKWIGKASRLGK